MGNRGAGGQHAAGAFDIDMDPLIVAGGLGELVDPLLVDVNPVARPDLRSNRCFDLAEVPEDAHRAP